MATCCLDVYIASYLDSIRILWPFTTDLSQNITFAIHAGDTGLQGQIGEPGIKGTKGDQGE